jgi:hypothetical protein
MKIAHHHHLSPLSEESESKVLIVDRSEGLVMWQAGFVKKLLWNGNHFTGKILEIRELVSMAMRSARGLTSSGREVTNRRRRRRTMATEAMEKG